MRTSQPQEFELTGERTTLRQLLRDLWESRELLRILARRDFHVRYRRPTLGVAWAVALPLIQAVVLAIIFSRVVRVETGVHHAVFMYSGILPWTFFSSTITQATRSIPMGAGIASKVYFPRAILPLVSVGSSLYGVLPNVGALLVFAVVFDVGLSERTLLLIPAFVLMLALTAAFGLLLAAIHVYMRDMGFIVQAVTQVWFYGSAVIYPLSLAPEGPLRFAIRANPATGVVEAWRAAIIGLNPDWLQAVWWTVGWTGVLLVAAAILYRRYDRTFIDLL